MNPPTTTASGAKFLNSGVITPIEINSVSPIEWTEMRIMSAVNPRHVLFMKISRSMPVTQNRELKRLEKDLAKANKELEQTGKKLANENFLSKAPAEVVEKIRTRQQVAQEEVERINARLEALRK